MGKQGKLTLFLCTFVPNQLFTVPHYTHKVAAKKIAHDKKIAKLFMKILHMVA
jgi:hypothetical protein